MEIHRYITVLFSLLATSFLFEPLGADGFLGGAIALAHGEWVGNSDIVLSLAALGYHVLFEHQGVLEGSLEAPFDLLRVLIFKSLRLSPCCVDVSDAKATENELLIGAKFAALREADHEVLPGYPDILVLFRDAHEQAIECLSFFVGCLTHNIAQVVACVAIVADVVEELFELNIVEVLLLAELALLKNATHVFQQIMAYIDDTLAFNQLECLRLDNTQ
mmetsp:Transcript_7931/g.11106  ORF Transcript_7931/g.11106 Transcript_7931/m.11106 type:complete len:219 (-) Transcript_7931:262-918(-)